MVAALLKRLGPVVVVATVTVITLSGCTEGTVWGKRSSRDRFGMVTRELCIGDSRETCTWIHQRKPAWYTHCDVGEQYPRCARIQNWDEGR
jgi:hypothetical protein